MEESVVAPEPPSRRSLPLVDMRMVDQHTATMVNAAPVSTDETEPPMLSNGLHWKLPLFGSLLTAL